MDDINNNDNLQNSIKTKIDKINSLQMEILNFNIDSKTEVDNHLSKFKNEINSDLLELNIDSPLTEKDANELLMRSFKITKPSLDNFVTIKYTKKPSEIILPKQKDINLKDPDLRNKGIRKKKNIINKYDENLNSKKEIAETTDKET